MHVYIDNRAIALVKDDIKIELTPVTVMPPFTATQKDIKQNYFALYTLYVYLYFLLCSMNSTSPRTL